MEIKLDRALASFEWSKLFPLAKLYNLEGSPSDHSPIFLEPKVHHLIRGNRKFKFENAWLLEPLCSQIIRDNWQGDRGQDIIQKILHCSESLEVWGKEIIGCFNRRIKECKRKLKSLQNARDEEAVKQYKEAKQELFLVLDQKEVFWRQRSKQMWLQVGDKNRNCFHAACNIR